MSPEAMAITAMEPDDYKAHLPDNLYIQITEICDIFHDIQKEATGIVQSNGMPDSTAQLHDVLNTTEKATNDILNAALEIQSSNSDPTTVAQVTKILEACNFQDLTGQRIKKVLRHLAVLDERLSSLAATARVQNPHYVESEPEKLERGPQLAEQAPSQEDIDALFGS